MIGNCKDCRHWEFHQDMRGDAELFRVPAQMKGQS